MLRAESLQINLPISLDYSSGNTVQTNWAGGRCLLDEFIHTTFKSSGLREVPHEQELSESGPMLQHSKFGHFNFDAAFVHPLVRAASAARFCQTTEAGRSRAMSCENTRSTAATATQGYRPFDEPD